LASSRQHFLSAENSLQICVFFTRPDFTSEVTYRNATNKIEKGRRKSLAIFQHPLSAGAQGSVFRAKTQHVIIIPLNKSKIFLFFCRCKRTKTSKPCLLLFFFFLTTHKIKDRDSIFFLFRFFFPLLYLSIEVPYREKKKKKNNVIALFCISVTVTRPSSSRTTDTFDLGCVPLTMVSASRRWVADGTCTHAAGARDTQRSRFRSAGRASSGACSVVSSWVSPPQGASDVVALASRRQSRRRQCSPLRRGS